MAEDTKPPISSDRDGSGRFQPGCKGGPGGRRKMSDAELTMLGDACPKAIKALIDALGANKSAAFNGIVIASDVPDHEVRKGAAMALLDRKYGKPAQSIEGPDGGPVQFQNAELTNLSDAQFAAVVALRDALKAGK